MIFGIILIVVGVLGFVPGLTTDRHLLGIFHVNPLHNLLHIASGVVAVWASRSARYAKTYFQVFGIIYALLAVLGAIYGYGYIFGIIANNTADIWLHLVISATSLYLGFAVRIAEEPMPRSRPMTPRPS